HLAGPVERARVDRYARLGKRRAVNRLDDRIRHGLRAPTARRSVFFGSGFEELRLGELLQRPDRARHLRAERRRGLDRLLALFLRLLREADIAAVGDRNLDVLLPFDPHAWYLLGSVHASPSLLRVVASREVQVD